MDAHPPSTSSGSPRLHTPPTDADADSRSGRSLAPREMSFTFRSRSPSPANFGDPRRDRVLPSIEREYSTESTTDSIAAPTPSTPTRESTTAPSLAFTPPPSDSRSRDAGFDVPYYFSGIDMNNRSSSSAAADQAGGGGSSSSIGITDNLHALDLSGSSSSRPRLAASASGHRRSRSNVSQPPEAQPAILPPPSPASRPALTPARQSAPPAVQPAPRDGSSSLDMRDLAQALDDASRTQGEYLHPSEARAQSEPLLRRSARRASSRGVLTRHEVHEEELPTERIHDPAFQDAFQGAKRLMCDLEAVLGSGSLHHEPDTVMKGLYEKAKLLSAFRCPATRTVGFVGDSGVGKSSLLNSLLDVDELARTSNSGGACTCVVTEYHYHAEDDFSIDVDWFSAEELKTQLEEHIKNYRQYHLRDPEMEQEEMGYSEEMATFAIDTFHSMFRRDDIEGFLVSRSEAEILDTFMVWAGEACPALNGDASPALQLATAAQCSDEIMRLTSVLEGPGGSALWPYVKQIRVYLKAHILSKGLILVDLPGLRDRNSARQKITERYILRCDEVFAICNSGRATSDAGVVGVFELARRARLSNVGIICTKADDISSKEARKDWRGPDGEQVQRLIDAVDRDAQRCQTLEAEVDQFVDDGDLTEEEEREHRQLLIRLRKEKKQKDDHEMQLTRFLVQTRNARIIEDLQNTYRERMVGNNLRAFCISNKMYWAHRDEEKTAAMPYLKLSGVLDVRKHCISIVAASQLRAATRYMKDDIPAHLGAVQLWVESGAGSITAEQKQAIRSVVNEVDNRLRTALTGPDAVANDMPWEMKEKFRHYITDAQSSARWTRAAYNASLQWTGWNPQSYKAFCCNFGIHKTEGAGSHNWNEEAIASMKHEMSGPWERLVESLHRVRDRTSMGVKEALRGSVGLLDEAPAICQDSLLTLKTTLRHQQRLLDEEMEALFDDFNGELETLETEALSGIRSSFAGQLMEASYVACNREGDRGSDRRRKNIIEGRLRDVRFFRSHHIEFKKEFAMRCEDLGSRMQDTIAAHVLVVEQTLDMLRNENVALESERDPEFRRRVADEIDKVKETLAAILLAIEG